MVWKARAQEMVDRVNGNGNGDGDPPLKSDYHTSGLPENLYNKAGEGFSTLQIDEGNFSKIRGRKNKFVIANESSDKYTKGEKLYFNKP